MENTKEGQPRYDSELAFFCGVGIELSSSGESPVRRRTPVIIGLTYGEAGLVGAGNQKCGLNSGEACVHRSRECNAASKESAPATGGRVLCFYWGFRCRSVLAYLQLLANQDQIARQLIQLFQCCRGRSVLARQAPERFAFHDAVQQECAGRARKGRQRGESGFDILTEPGL